uniref:Dynein light chain n=1 Tax=Sinocyclocheilus rhinocerous TaxID=307959 RepID=A0A673J0J8_9TELE
MAKTSIKIKIADMSDEMQREVLQCAFLAVNMYEDGLDIATYIKKEFDRRHQPNWHCIVGNCSSHVTHNKSCYISFDVGNKHIVLFKTS